MYPALLAVDIHHIAQALEGKEGNTDGQADAGHRDIQPGDAVEDFSEKTGIFVNNQHSDIQNRRCGHRQLIVLFSSGQSSEEVVQDNGDQHDHHGHRFSIGIEDQTGNSQNKVSGCMVPNQCVKQKRHRQKHK